VHPHFLGRFGPHQPEKQKIQGKSEHRDQTGIPCMQCGNKIEWHFLGDKLQGIANVFLCHFSFWHFHLTGANFELK
jgi:hypothetical protein